MVCKRVNFHPSPRLKKTGGVRRREKGRGVKKGRRVNSQGWATWLRAMGPPPGGNTQRGVRGGEGGIKDLGTHEYALNGIIEAS